MQPKMATAIQVQCQSYDRADREDSVKANKWLKTLDKLNNAKKLEMVTLKLTGFAIQWFKALPELGRSLQVYVCPYRGGIIRFSKGSDRVRPN